MAVAQAREVKSRVGSSSCLQHSDGKLGLNLDFQVRYQVSRASKKYRKLSSHSSVVFSILKNIRSQTTRKSPFSFLTGDVTMVTLSVMPCFVEFLIILPFLYQPVKYEQLRWPHKLQ